MKYENILFDLDGTLTDPYTGITNSFTYALGKFGITETDREKLSLVIGPPLENSFRKCTEWMKTQQKRQ
ncbi:HAD hydrolase-like protein [Brucepastera parasyntrophica]|uniref:HAD hydrolase-like protein n=1 Tax=Brucepastera parasyntrophica TaxID=2880008 RepID=UPI00210D7F81|nr:HAD hydrolase-like protein [Brucepastera parasyntrophica]ULQ58453.1 HAD hydrolase-like protein [Brucepastera parasyntrophica]